MTDFPVVLPGSDIEVTREHCGPFERIVLTAPVRVPGEPFLGTAEVSVYALGDLLIDAGPSRGVAALVDALAGGRPKRILLTHQHEDHTGGVTGLRRAFGDIAVFAPRPLLPLLTRPEPIGGYRTAYWGDPEPIPDAEPVDEGDVIQATGLHIEAIATPGHTPGHMSYLARAGDRVYGLTGDLLVNTRSYFGFFESSVPDLIRSLQRIAEIGDALHVLPAHGRTRPDGSVTLRKAAAWLAEESTTIRDASVRLGTADPVTVALHLYGPPEPVELATGGDFSTVALVRSVLDPPRAHPIERLDLRTAADHTP